jgi:3-hydroxyacyl-[acyl-carrier-protein] dehydratase
MQIEARLDIAPDHPAFAGHFPGKPILPGVVLLDAVVDTLLQMRRRQATDSGGDFDDTCQIISAKFLSPVGPGETLIISLNTAASGNTRFDITSGERKVATGLLAMPLLP